MLEWLRKRAPAALHDAPRKVKVYLNPLHAMLHAAEKRKGAHLTETEVLQVRDETVSVEMTEEQAQRFYASLDAQMPIGRMSPDRIWEEWQEIRDQVR
jgi:hypothetical protein